MDRSLFGPMGEPTTIWVTPVAKSSSTLARQSAGVPETEKDRIFDLFYTTGGSLSDGNKGVGLGLALCRAVVEAHGGIITVGDNAPHGAVFRFTLPAEEVPTDGE